jgi:hypothetical protein
MRISKEIKRKFEVWRWFVKEDISYVLWDEGRNLGSGLLRGRAGGADKGYKGSDMDR